MNSIQCAEEIADYFQRMVVKDSMKLRTLLFESESEEQEEINVYTGFLPYAGSDAEKKKLCPAIIVRPELVEDRQDCSLVHLLITVTSYDRDKQKGFYSLYSLLEWIRFRLLAHTPIDNKWLLQDGSLTMGVPSDQPYPQWWGYIEAVIYIPRPLRNEAQWFYSGYKGEHDGQDD